MWGKALMISPVLEKDATNRSIYLSPESRWYSVSEFFTIENFYEEPSGGWITYEAPMEVLPLHLRGGAAVPFQQPGLNTVESRKGGMGIMLPLDGNNESEGDLYYDDGESIGSQENGDCLISHFQMIQGEISYNVMFNHWEGSDELMFTVITVLGFRDEIESITVNGVGSRNFYQDDKGMVTIYMLQLPASENWTIKLNTIQKP
eukprot:TRINITY_DN6434_c0_g1_i7.p1 TRINITY_DN6434_c0_g1~~TRINITY_DN6434_c0_g1_i7.p1  ORF type:complete len:204 (-),score=18.23 TRINITY_DN6434_c0_g1_i7:54-665(-)